MMQPVNHIFLMRSILDYHNCTKNLDFYKNLRRQYSGSLSKDTFGRTIFVRQNLQQYESKDWGEEEEE